MDHRLWRTEIYNFQQAKRIRSTVTRLKTKSKRMSQILKSKSEQVEHEDKLPNTVGNK